MLQLALSTCQSASLKTYFAQAWHLGTSTFVLVTHTIFHTQRSTHPLSHTIFVNHLCHAPAWHLAGVALGVAGVALMALGWLWWRAWPVLVAGDAAALCVAGVALSDIHLRTWQACTWDIHLRFAGRGTYLVARLGPFWSPVTPRHFAWQAWHLGTSTFVSRSRRGTWGHPPSFCVAGVALMALGWFWWRAWARFGRR